MLSSRCGAAPKTSLRQHPPKANRLFTCILSLCIYSRPHFVLIALLAHCLQHMARAIRTAEQYQVQLYVLETL